MASKMRHLAVAGLRAAAVVSLFTCVMVSMAADGRAAANLPGARPTPMPAPKARIVPIASLDSFYLGDAGAWSPGGQRLALARFKPGQPARIWVFDAARPKQPPRVVFDGGWVHSFSWSPDGEWLLVRTGYGNDRHVLLAVPVDGGPPDTLSNRRGVYPAVWGPDGRIYCWLEGRRRFVLAPPARWVPARGTQLHAPPVAVVAADLSLRLRYGAPGPAEEPLLLGANFGAINGLRLKDRLPDGSKSLISISRDSVARWRIVDGDGRTVTDLRTAGFDFEPTGLSADGRLLVGFTGSWTRAHGWALTSLRVADSGGAWNASIAGGEGGSRPQFSREGMLLAYTVLGTNGTRVGRLVLTPR